jgi:SAM-dependent methyltransferase
MRRGGIAEKLGKALPPKLRHELSSGYKEYMFHRLARQLFNERVLRQNPGPLPPAAVITTEALMHKHDLEIATMPARYFGGGYRDAWIMLSMLQSCGADLTAFRSILEFGCGSARVLRHFRSVRGLHLVGTDANPRVIEWDRLNLPGADFHVNELQPPLRFADDCFDFVYALSVFTHIPLQWQEAWLRELRRILRPRGYLLCTVLGENYVKIQLSPEDRVRLERNGMLTLDPDNPRTSYSSQVLRSWDVFQTRDEVCKRFGAMFDILSYTESPAATGQDTLLLRRPQRPC